MENVSTSRGAWWKTNRTCSWYLEILSVCSFCGPEQSSSTYGQTWVGTSHFRHIHFFLLVWLALPTQGATRKATQPGQQLFPTVSGSEKSKVKSQSVVTAHFLGDRQDWMVSHMIEGAGYFSGPFCSNLIVEDSARLHLSGYLFIWGQEWVKMLPCTCKGHVRVIFLLHQVCLGDWTQVLWLGNKGFYWHSHLAIP